MCYVELGINIPVNEPFCGDVNSDNVINGWDVEFLVEYMFGGGATPSPLWIADIDGDGADPNIADLVYLVGYVYNGGPAPRCVSIAMGLDVQSPTDGCGDVNSDSRVNEDDVFFLKAYMFEGGPQPNPMSRSDVNGDGMGPDISDLVYLVNYIFQGGLAPFCGQLSQGLDVIAPASGCGDANVDGRVNQADIEYMTEYMFKDGPAPEPMSRGDSNGDGSIDVSDLVYMVNYIFKGGIAPVCPGTAIGLLCGDFNNNAKVDALDVEFLQAYMFSGGPAPAPMWIADVNGDGEGPDIGDLTYLVGYVHQNGPLPTCIPKITTLNITAPPDGCGDVNSDNRINEDDIYYLSAYMFEGGPTPSPLSKGDIDGSGSIDVSDLTYLVAYVNSGGPAPICTNVTFSLDVPAPADGCGDIDGNNRINGGDIDYLTDYMFSGGPAPVPMWIADVNGNGEGPDIGDLTYLTSYVYRGGPAPDCVNVALGLNVAAPPDGCGDTNSDSMVNEVDVNYLSAYMFEGGPPPSPMERGDVNGGGSIDISDLVYLVNYVYQGGPAPTCPNINTGIDMAAPTDGCGDTNSDSRINSADVDYLVAYMFEGGPEPSPLEAGNVDGVTGVGGLIDVGDLTYLVAYVYSGGPAPNCPQLSTGIDVPAPSSGCGDVDADGRINMDDVNYLMDYMFTGGPAPVPMTRGDMSGDGSIDIGDLTTISAYVSGSGPAPRCGLAVNMQ